MSSYRPSRSSNRSRSPANRQRQATLYTRRRSSSPQSHHHSHHKRIQPLLASPTFLPFKAVPLTKHDFLRYKPLYALYLDIQKQLTLEDIPDAEVRGRWKSFLRKWNRGELAEGWYEPAALQKAIGSAPKPSFSLASVRHRQSSLPHGGDKIDRLPGNESDEDDDAVGPALPTQSPRDGRNVSRLGPAIPGMQDLELKRELAAEDSLSARDVLRNKRELERKQEKERLEELAPRAEAGSKERMLEKKREKAATNRAFASGKTDSGEMAEVPESDLLGDDAGGVDGFKKQKREMERKKNEREIRKEEILRARAAEREERVKHYRQKEEATMKGLVELAKARFG